MRNLLVVVTLALPAAVAADGLPEPPPTLGFIIAPLSEETRREIDFPEALGGAVVLHVYRGSPAFRAGVRDGDVIRRIDGRSYPSPFFDPLSGRSVGANVHAAVWREGETETLDVRLADAPLLFSWACADGEPLACTQLGLLFLRGEGVPQDEARAASLLHQACSADEIPGCTALAALHLSETSGLRDDGRAAALLERACGAGDPAACGQLGLLAANGQGVPRDDARARAPREGVRIR